MTTQAKPNVYGVRWVNPETFETIRVRGGARTGPHGEVLQKIDPTLDLTAFANAGPATARPRRPSRIVTTSGALAGLRVLDLSTHRAHLCARLLADMGADVIKVEPPAGDEGRRIGPFYNDLPHHDRSLFFWFYNLNKRSLTLDLTRPRGRELAARARALRRCRRSKASRPARSPRSASDGSSFIARNPALILLSIAPFGQTGPYRDFEADDTVITALSGHALCQRLARTPSGAAARACRRIIRRPTTARSPR